MHDSYLPSELLRAVPPELRSRFIADYRELAELPETDCDLPALFGGYLDKLVRLYAAVAGAIWFRSADSRRVALHATRGYEPLGLVGDTAASHEALVHYALAQPRSLLVAPHARPHDRAQVLNPTGQFILLGPLISHGDHIGVVELFLGTAPSAVAAEQPNGYVAWLDDLLALLAHGVEQRFQGNLAPLQPELTNLEATRAEIAAFKEAIRVSLEITLNSYAGRSFGSLRNNQTFTRSIHELLEANGLRVECPECRAPAILRCQPAGNAKTGVFLYDHYLTSGRTFHGGPATFPRVKLVAKSPRRRSR